MRRVLAMSAALAALLIAGSDVLAADDVPESLQPFAYLVGGWKGQAIPQANRLKGWQEKHNWAWKFEKGTPVGLSVSFESDKALKQGDLLFDPASKGYRLTGQDAQGKAVTYAGKLDSAGKMLTLLRTGTVDGAKERITLRPNSEKIRYTLTFDRQEEGAPQFAKFIDVGLTKEGEAFAAGGSAADLPKCIVTGGAAGMTVSFEGKSFPICCSGCRDEFNDNPAKYVKKALLRMQSGDGKMPVKTASSVGKDDGSFDGLVDDPKPKAKSKTATKPKTAEPKDEPAAEPKASTKPATKPVADPAARAASLLAQARALEKGGNTDAALGYYRRIVKEFADTPSAKTAGERIKALGK